MSTSTMDNLDQLLLDRLKSRDESLDSGTSRIVNSRKFIKIYDATWVECANADRWEAC